MTKEQRFVTEGNEKADELAKEESNVDGGQMTAAKALKHWRTKELDLRP